MSVTKTKPVHYMQSADWAHLRPEAGWEVLRLSVGNQKVYAYRKKTPAGGMVYIPGFISKSSNDLNEIKQHLKTKSNLVCKIEACYPYDEQVEKWFVGAGWKRARNVQYYYTVRLDLTQPENDLWMGMKPRGRQEINYAKRDQVKIESVEPNEANLEIMHSLLQETSLRKDFGIRNKQGTMHYWLAFAGSGHLSLFFAKSGDKIIAGGIFLTDGSNKVWYKDAGSKPEFNKLFGPRLLLWEAALHFKRAGFKTFDLGGIPSPETYETSPMKGVYIFKTAFTREVTKMMPAYELPLKPLLYPVWNKLEPTALKTRRKLSTIKGKLKG